MKRLLLAGSILTAYALVALAPETQAAEPPGAISLGAVDFSACNGLVEGVAAFAPDCITTLPASSIPAPTSTTLGGVEAASAPTNQFQTGINTSGVPQFAQPAIANLSGLGVGVAAALGANTGTVGSFVVNGGALGTPSGGNGANITGVNAATLGGNVLATILPSATPSQIYIGTGAAGAAAASSTLPAAVAIPSQTISVKQFGAIGNSNGTHGNGNDDTSSINEAISAAPSQGAVYFPCGTYRITGPLGGTTAAGTYHLRGDGWCSQIFLDNSVPAFAVQITNDTGCLINCVDIEGLNFITPTSPAGTVAIDLSGELHSVVIRNYFSGYEFVEFLSTSYAPFFANNFATGIRGSLIATAGDVSLNNARIWNNNVLNSGETDSSAVLTLNCGGALHGNLSVIGNDLEESYAGVEFAGCNSVDFSDNYIETMTAYDWNFLTGTTNTSYSVRNNWFGQSAATTIGPVTKLVLDGNTLYDWALTWNTTALGVEVKPTNVLKDGATIGAPPAPTLSACGSGTPSLLGGSTRERGQIFEGTTATGCTATFELAYDTTPVCTFFGNSVAALAATSISTTGFTVINTSGSGGSFMYDCMSTH